MTVQERIARNREMDARVAARQEAERPALESRARRKMARKLCDLIFSFPENEQRPVAAIVIRVFRPDVAERLGL